MVGYLVAARHLAEQNIRLLAVMFLNYQQHVIKIEKETQIHIKSFNRSDELLMAHLSPGLAGCTSCCWPCTPSSDRGFRRPPKDLAGTVSRDF